MSDEDGDGEVKEETLGQLKQRHKRELKELASQIKELQHVNKKDKAEKAKAEAKAEKLESKMKVRHEVELKAKQDEEDKGRMAQAMEDLKLQTDEANRKAALSNQKRLEAAEAEKQRHAEVVDSLKHRADPRALENEQLQQRLEPLRRTVHEIASDGNCLYRAVAHQLSLVPAASSAAAAASVASASAASQAGFAALRRLAADEMRQHPDNYLPYLTTDDGELLSDAGFAQYLSDMVDEAKAVWGGQPEVVALATALRVPITVHRATDPPLVLGDALPAGAAADATLHISFHSHYFGLGAHYNSIVPKA